MVTSGRDNLRRKRALADALSGVGGALVSLWTFYPIEVWKTNLQAGSAVTEPDSGTINQAKSSTNTSMRNSPFQGCGAKTLHTATSNFCYFFIYSWILAYWKKRKLQGSQLNPGTRLLLSAVAAMLNTLITLPLDVISSKQVTLSMQKESPSSSPNTSGSLSDSSSEGTERVGGAWEGLNGENSSSDSEFQECFSGLEKDNKEETSLSSLTTLEAREALEMPETEGARWTSLWKGLAPALLLCSNPSINYTVFDIVKNQILSRPGPQGKLSLSMPEAFFVGLFAKFVATIATYPLIRAKVILMVTSEKSMFACIIRSYREGGIRRIYKGCDWQLLHTVLKSALMMTVKEKIALSTQRLVVGEGSPKSS